MKASEVTRDFLKGLGEIKRNFFTFAGEAVQYKVAFRRDGTLNGLCSGVLNELAKRKVIEKYEPPKRGRRKGSKNVRGKSRLSKKVLRPEFWERYDLDMLDKAEAAIAAARPRIVEREREEKKEALLERFNEIKGEADRLGIELG